MVYYVAILDGSGDVWGVRIPDVPGCFGRGATPQDAIADVASALTEVIIHQAAWGRTLLQPRSIEAVVADPESEFDDQSGDALVMIPVALVETRHPGSFSD